jgi:hypothetical protein
MVDPARLKIVKVLLAIGANHSEVEPRGIEPRTSAVQRRRSPS